MTYYIQALILTFIEASCCTIFFDTFINANQDQKKWRQTLFFVVLCLGFIVISLFPANAYLLKAVVSVLYISLVMIIEYKNMKLQIFFLAIGYYGLLICIDRIMLIIIQNIFFIDKDDFFIDPIKGTIVALLCKTILFLCIFFLNRKLKPDGNLNLSTDKEWIKFLFFPIVTIICMTAFAVEENPGNKASLVASFSLVLLNFLVLYIIRDVVSREKDVQEIRLSKERIKNQMKMYGYMDAVYSSQRNKIHEFKNQIGCIQGLVEKNKCNEALVYLKSINENWLEEIDFVDTNHALVNSVINQKFKLAKSKGIPIILSVNDQNDLRIHDEDIVIILSNLLDNAIEACEKIKKGKKIIKFRLINEKTRVIISVKNTVSEHLEINGNRIISAKKNKEEHGIGLVNVEKSVKKYGGQCVFSCNEGFFTYSIVVDL